MNVYENQVNLEGHSAQNLAVSATAASAQILEPGVYAVWATVDTSIKVAQSDTEAESLTVATGFPITASSPVMPVRITRASYLGAIAGGSGTLYYHKIA